MEMCTKCACAAHCGISCMECWDCTECGCINCEPPKINIDNEGYPYPTGDD